MTKHVREFISEEALMDLLADHPDWDIENGVVYGSLDLDVFTTGTQVTGAFIDGTIYTTYEAQEADNG